MIIYVQVNVLYYNKLIFHVITSPVKAPRATSTKVEFISFKKHMTDFV